MNKELKILRVKNELTQEQMAKKLGLSHPNYQMIESGKRKGKISFWKKVYETFEVSAEEIVKIMFTQEGEE